MLSDLAVCIADGGRVLSDLATLRDQPELYGLVASDPTAWRTLYAIDDRERAAIAATRAKSRRRLLALIADRRGAIPPSRVADVDLGKTVVIRMDATSSSRTRTRRARRAHSTVRMGIIGWPRGATTPATASEAHSARRGRDGRA